MTTVQGAEAGGGVGLPPGDWMTRKQVAEYLSIHVDTVLDWARRYRLKVTRMGKMAYYRRSAIDKMLDERSRVAR